MRIAVLALDAMFDTGQSVTLDAFSAADTLSERMMNGTPRFDVSLVGVRRRVRPNHGLQVPVQAAYTIPNPLAQADPLIQRFEQRSRANLKAGFPLQRRCQDVLGKSPLAYFQDLRVDLL